MTIKIGSYVLCDGYDRTPGKLVGPVGLSGGNNVVSQVVNPIRASKATILDRANVSWSFSWSCNAAFADEAAAVAFVVAFKANCPTSGVLYFDDVSQGTGTLTYRYQTLGASASFQFTAEVAL